MTSLVLAYTGTLVAFALLDLVWLGYVARGFYQSQVGALLRTPPRWWAAALLYAIYAAGIAGFVVVPALDAGSFPRALVAGAAFGLVVYGTYDLTNLAILRGWTVGAAVVDVLWGTAVTAAAAAAGFGLARLAAAAA
ncbi:MAG: DUF2177 family protein [Betaproteobacteria bacterium]|nr:DUF2177 family protein [Betaproteobacteria bacterium]MCC7216116.1 DUF2177 family protein [Burkholderiales bacterium]